MPSGGPVKIRIARRTVQVTEAAAKLISGASAAVE